MSGFICGADRSQGMMFPAQLEDYVAEDNPVRVIDFFVDQLDLRALGFSAVDPKETGRPAYHPAIMLKIYVYLLSTAFNRAAGLSGNASAMLR
jgi:transposase